MKNTANETPNKTWEKTKVQNLLRHKSGRYYARTFGNNKENWKSLRTDHFSVAKARLAEFLREHREKQATAANQSSTTRRSWGIRSSAVPNYSCKVRMTPSTCAGTVTSRAVVGSSAMRSAGYSAMAISIMTR